MEKIFIFLGPPGSGKGTQASRLSKKRSIPNISTGKIFRELSQKDDDLGKRIQEKINKGELIEDETVDRVLQERLSEDDVSNGFILDGYPRNLSQSINLTDSILVGKDYWVIYVHVSDEEVKNRISQRRTCVDCGEVYHLTYKPPKSSNICDICGGDLVLRDDDSKEVMHRRLDIYHKEIDPILDYYKNKGRLIIVDGEQDIDKVFVELVNKINDKDKE